MIPPPYWPLTVSPCAVLLCAALLCLTAIPRGAAAADDPPSPPWERVGEDLDLAQVNVRVNPFLSSELLLVRSELKRHRVAVIKSTEFGRRRNTVMALGMASRAAVAINANFFDEQGKALGLIISRGIVNQGLHRGGETLSGIFEVTSTGLRIINRDTFEPLGVTEAVQAGPRLLSGGSRVRGLEASAFSKRSGVCIDGERRLILFAVSSGFLGLTMQQLQEVLMRPDIGCVDALNLDGGGSAQLWISGKIPGASRSFSEIFVQGADTVPVALALVPKEPPQTE